MKLVVTHKSCDLDAIASSWIIKKFLPGFENAEMRFVPAGGKLKGIYLRRGEIIERVDDHDVIHVDTGLGPLDHHQTGNSDICATSLAFDYVLMQNEHLSSDKNKVEALRRIVEYAVNEDHFQEVFFPNPENEIYDFSIVSLIHGIKLIYPKDDQSVMAFGMDVLGSLFHYFENKIWAEKEIAEKGARFDTKWGRGLAIESLNDTVLKLAQVMGYIISVRKDPSTGSVRIKARPKKRKSINNVKNIKNIKRNDIFEDVDIDLTPVYEKLKKMDSDATWYLHASKRMLLNGSSKNPEMKGSKLTLDQVVEVLQNI